MRPTHVESPQTSATSAHSPGESISTGKMQFSVTVVRLCNRLAVMLLRFSLNEVYLLGAVSQAICVKK
jgi:hypothetical protein